MHACAYRKNLTFSILYILLAEFASNEAEQIDTAMIKVSDVSVNCTRENLLYSSACIYCNIIATVQWGLKSC